METETSSDQRPVIQARDILAKIERGEDVEYDGVIVEGDLDITELELPTEYVYRTEDEKMRSLPEELKVISSKITITNSEIQGIVNFVNVCFQEKINFNKVKFVKNVCFRGAKFELGSSYSEAKFCGAANFRQSELGNYNDFMSAEFGDDAQFGEANFGMGTYFALIKFKGNAFFIEAKFSGRDSSLEATYFNDVKFEKDARFEQAEFIGVTIFSDTEFGGDAKFRLVNFSGFADFYKTKFSGVADFTEANFSNNDSYFMNVAFDNELILDRFKFEKLYIAWDSIKGKLVYNGPVYLALIKNFKVIERFSDADDCYYAYRKESQDQKPWYSQKNWLIDNVVRFYSWISTNIKRIFKYFSWISNCPPITWIHRFTWSKLFDWIGLVSCGYGVTVVPH